MKRKPKTAAMFWGEYRAEQRARMIEQAERALSAGRYEEATALARRAMRYKSRHSHFARAKLYSWRTKFLRRIQSARDKQAPRGDARSARIERAEALPWPA